MGCSVRHGVLGGKVTMGDQLRLALLVCLGTLACTDDFPCDSHQVLKDNQCVPDNTGGEDRAQDAGRPNLSDAPPGDSGDAGESKPSNVFGRTCSADSDCEAGTPTCGIPPGATRGTCTITGCASGSVECPDGWHCLSVADACIED